jgi:4-amino-4-deoxy-L-arabinose transferase-like glycosyltransferase
VLLLAISPWFLFMSASFMTHPITLVWSLIAFLAVEKARESGRSRWGLLAGASLGALFLTRPLEAVLIAGIVGLWSLGIWGRRLSIQALAGVGLAALLVAGLSLPYNALLTGSPFYFPMERYFDQRWYPGVNRLGFGPDIGNVGWPHVDPLPGHGPLDVLINANLNAYLLNFELFGWAFGSLGFVFLLMVWRRWTRTDWLLLSIIAVIVGGYSFYWFSGGPDFGARYWYQALIPLVVLTVRGIQEMQRRWSEAGGTPLGSSRISAFVVAASLVAVVTFVPWRSLGKYRHYRGMRADVVRLAHAHEFGRSLVFVQERDKSDYPSAAIFNPPGLDLPGTIYARDTGPAGRATVAQYFPNRPIWVVAGSPVLGGPFTVVAGPLPPLSASQAKSFTERP